MNELQEKEIAVRYFLGELSGGELESVEERFFTDAEYSDFLDEVEADLIDEYVRGEISGDQKQKFEKNYLVSEHRQSRLKAANALWEREQLNAVGEVRTVVAASPTSIWQRIGELFQVPKLAYALSALVILLLAGGIWLGLRKKEDDIARVTPTPTPITTPTPFISTPTPNINAGNQNENTQPKNTPKQIDSNKQNPEQEKDSPENRQIEAPQPMIATFILSGGGMRGNGDIQKLTFSTKTKTVLLKIADEQISKYNKFQLEIENENGTKVLSRELKTKKSVKNLTIGLPAQNLQKGLHKLTVKGAKDDGEFEPIDIYKFSVEKK